jgi:hypothetical protein
MASQTKRPPKEWSSKIISYQRFLQAQTEARERSARARAETRAKPVASDADRVEKIRQVRERIREGFYNRPDVLEEIAARMLAALPETVAADDSKGGA